jgi:hypothetical protein
MDEPKIERNDEAGTRKGFDKGTLLIAFSLIAGLVLLIALNMN